MGSLSSSTAAQRKRPDQPATYPPRYCHLSFPMLPPPGLMRRAGETQSGGEEDEEGSGRGRWTVEARVEQRARVRSWGCKERGQLYGPRCAFSVQYLACYRVW